MLSKGETVSNISVLIVHVQDGGGMRDCQGRQVTRGYVRSQGEQGRRGETMGGRRAGSGRDGEGRGMRVRVKVMMQAPASCSDLAA
eukprot:249372-Rhodomonas_salina.3